MSTSSDLEELITLKQRRRRQLKKVQAVKGVDTNPEVLIEIEDLEAELPRLKTELVDAMQQEAEAKAPLLHLANFQPPPAALPAGVIILDWSGHFQAKPRSLPDPAVWATELLPELAGLPARLGPPGLVRLEGSAALSTGLAVGHTFPNVGRYRLSLAQHTPTGPQTWLSDAPALAGADPTFTPHIALGPAGAEDGLIVIAAAPQPTLAGLLAQVGHSWGEGAGLAQHAPDRERGGRPGPHLSPLADRFHRPGPAGPAAPLHGRPAGSGRLCGPPLERHRPRPALLRVAGPRSLRAQLRLALRLLV